MRRQVRPKAVLTGALTNFARNAVSRGTDALGITQPEFVSRGTGDLIGPTRFGQEPPPLELRASRSNELRMSFEVGPLRRFALEYSVSRGTEQNAVGNSPLERRFTWNGDLN